MNWLAPWFLVGLTAVALPLWLHRLQTRRPQQRPFASTMLMENAERRLLVQRRLRYWALLLARLALLVLLALCFARPEWRLPAGRAATQRAGLTLLVVDTSLSMQADAAFERARAAALADLQSLGADMRVRLISAGGSIEALGGVASADRGTVRNQLLQLAPGAGRLDVAQLMNALDGFAGDERGIVRVDFYSDFQQSGAPVQFADLLPRAAAGRSFELHLHEAARQAAAANWRVAALVQQGDAIQVTVTAMHAPARTLPVELRVDGRVVATQSVAVPADGSATARFSSPAPGTAQSRLEARIAPADALGADDVRYAVLQNLRADPVPLLGADAQGASARYLDAAYRAAGDRYRIEPHGARDFDLRTLARYRWVIVADQGALDESQAAALRTWLGNGGAVFAALGPRSAPLTRAPLSQDALNWPVARGDEPLQIGAVESSHPLLTRTSGWQAASFARLARIAPQTGDAVLLATNDGTPVLIERRVGAGRLLLFASSFDNDWNDLPLQPVFVGFLAELGDYLAARGEAGRDWVAGNTLALQPPAGGAVQLLDPDGRELLGLAQTRSATRVTLARTGFYQLDTAERQQLLAVNTDARESDLAVMDAAALGKWREAAAATRSAPAVAMQSGDSPTLPIWRTLLWLFVLVVLLESVLGMLHLRQTVRA